MQCFREDGRILGITDINTRFGGAFPLPQAAGAGYVQIILAIAAGERPAPSPGRSYAWSGDDPLPQADAAGREPSGLAPLGRGLGPPSWNARSPSGTTARVIWSGRWLILTTTVVAALVGLALSFVASTSYTATAELFVGQATQRLGNPRVDAWHEPRPGADRADRRQPGGAGRRGGGRHPGRIRRGVELTAPRAPGGSVGNLPTVITVTFRDEDGGIARDAANAYATAIEAEAKEDFAGIIGAYEAGITTAQTTVERLESQMAGDRAQLATASGERGRLVLQSLLNSAGQQLQIATDRAEQSAPQPGQGRPAVPARHHLPRHEPELLGKRAQPPPLGDPRRRHRLPRRHHRHVRVAGSPAGRAANP